MAGLKPGTYTGFQTKGFGTEERRQQFQSTEKGRSICKSSRVFGSSPD